MKKKLDFILRITLGMVLAYVIANEIGLQYASTAATITFLIVINTKIDTVKRSLTLLISFFMSTIFAWIVFGHLGTDWTCYGVFILLLVGSSSLLDFKSTISVNAVLGTHYMTNPYFGWDFVLNELTLIIIGIVLSLLINSVRNYSGSRRTIEGNMRYIEEQLKDILLHIAEYLKGRNETTAWERIDVLEAYLQVSLEHAIEYNDNTFSSHSLYYIRYIEMRMKQCALLAHLHGNIERLRILPKQAMILGEYFVFLSGYVLEKNEPRRQMEKLHQMMENYRKDRLPESRQEFENRAILYHIMLELERFIEYKQEFCNMYLKNNDNTKEIF